MVGSIQCPVLRGGQREVALSRSPALNLAQSVTPTDTPRAGHVRKPGSHGATEQKPLLAPGGNGHSLLWVSSRGFFLGLYE